jgi:tetratricopeptide (TPR) repeat protein
LLGALLLLTVLAALPSRAQEQVPAAAQPTPLDTNDAKAVYDRAELYMVRKYYPEAVGLYIRLIELDPKNALYHNKLGIAYHTMGDLGRAKRAYQAAVKLNPAYPEATNNLAAVEYARNNYRGAILTYLKALELSPGDAVVYSNLGTAYFAYKKYEYAQSAYRYALLRDPHIFDRSGRTGNIVHNRDVRDIAAFNFYMAKTYASLQDVENTLIYINKAYEAEYADLLKNLEDPVFAFIAQEPRYLELLARLDPTRQIPPPQTAQ